jgi:nuclear protein localization family protein 4
MILRFQSKEGNFRLTVEPSTTFPDIVPQIAEHLPKNTDLQSITVSNKPHGGDARKLTSLRGISFKQVGLKWVAPPFRKTQLTS